MEVPIFTKISKSWEKMEKYINSLISNSTVGKYFKLEERKTCFTTELRAATTTFLAMAYIITVNSAVLATSGGPCTAGGDHAAYERCVSVVKSDLIVAISLASMIGCFSMGILANMPFGLGPGTGQTMYMTYNLVGVNGCGPLSHSQALGLWMAEAVVFIVISASGLRAKLGRLIPLSVRLACAAGIGLFMAFVGLQAHQGVGLIGPSPSSLVTATACSHMDTETGQCIGGEMQSPTFWLGLVGFLIMAYGLMNDIKGSMIYGILFVTFVSWFRGTSVTYFPKTNDGEARYRYFKKIVDCHMIKTTAGKISFSYFKKGDAWISLFTLLYIDLLATTGALYTLAEIGGFINENGTFENEYIAYMIDAGVTVVGSALGVPPVATYAESSTGIKEGGRTGLTAVIIGVYFLLSLFFAPLLTSVPPWAIGPSLVMVGVIMMKVAKDIEWSNIKEAVPAYVTMILMPLTSSIPNGIIGGIGIYVALHLYDPIAWFFRRESKKQNEVSKNNEGDEIYEEI